MKQFKTIILALITSITCLNANTITVSNDVNSPGQYTNLQVAIDAATTLSGDTILVAGSQTSYGSITISTKQIHLVGIGNDPMKQQAYNSEINSLTFTRDNSNLSLKSEGSTIQGFKIQNLDIIGINFTTASSNYVISRCSIFNVSIGGNSNSVLIYNNIITQIVKYSNSNNTSNYIISNNIITEYVLHEKFSPFSSDATQFITFKSNLFLDSFNDYSGYNFVVHNNIFKGTDLFSFFTSSEFVNNLIFGSLNDTFQTTGTNSGYGNIEALDPLFISETDNIYQDTDDFNTPSTSPVHNAGTDGTDIGIYGGAYPWPEGGISGSGFMYSQEPQFPQVNEMNISNLTVPSGGTLNVTSKGIINH